jgi:predicted DNA-binding ribbon-helix-helix protein
MPRITRNIEVSGQRTSFRLEPAFWEALIMCARERGISLDALISNVVRENSDAHATMASAIRVFAISHFHHLAQGAPNHGTA